MELELEVYWFGVLHGLFLGDRRGVGRFSCFVPVFSCLSACTRCRKLPASWFLLLCVMSFPSHPIFSISYLTLDYKLHRKDSPKKELRILSSTLRPRPRFHTRSAMIGVLRVGTRSRVVGVRMLS